ncbi:MAG: apolipoprotein N-acyltransferase [Microbacterium sp.]
MPATRTTAALGRPVLPLWAALVVSAGAGLLLTTAFPSLGWWPVVFVTVPGALTPLIGRRIRSSLLVGFVFGLGFFLVNVSFTARYLGPVPWLALTFLEAVLTGVAGVAITLAYRWLPRLLPAPWWRLTLLPALVAALWAMREQFLGSWPYGGFPWARIGVTQASGPLAPVASWVGISGLTFLIVFVAAAAVESVRVARLRRPLTALPALVVLIALFLVPQFPTTDAGTLRVGAVQGDGPAGYFDARTRDAVLEAQLSASEALAGQDIDVLLWPEGGVDSDPLASATTAAALDAVSESVDAPLLMNAATARGGEYFNSSMLWVAGEGATDIYDKRHLVPFGEYVPDRWLYAQLAPDLIGLLQLDETPGTAAPVMEVAGATVGLAICFDVIYDDVIWDGATGGAEVYLLQTNNADFRGTDENLQQLAFARMRAIETGRAVVNLSTVGTSQVIAPDGEVLDGLEEDTAGAMVTDVPLRTGLTPAVVVGPWIQAVLGWGGLVAVAGCGLLIGLRRRTSTSPTPERAGDVEIG